MRQDACAEHCDDDREDGGGFFLSDIASRLMGLMKSTPLSAKMMRATDSLATDFTVASEISIANLCLCQEALSFDGFRLNCGGPRLPI